jgi:Abi-like protein
VALARGVSALRLQRYIAIASGDTSQALRLYMWNTALSESLYGPLQGIEITLRNKIDERLTACFGAHWYDNPKIGIQFAQQRQINDAKSSLQFQQKPLDHSRIVAELNFGFWVGLLGRQYENLWRSQLRRIFINTLAPLLRKEAHKALNEIRFLRNRIAHHEAILQRRLPEEHALILTVTRWLCAVTADWIAHHSRFNEVYRLRP